MGAQGKGAGEVDQLQPDLAEIRGTNVFFDRCARIVCGALAQAGQTVEERAFSGIGVADNRDAGGWPPAHGYLINWNTAYARASHRQGAATR